MVALQHLKGDVASGPFELLLLPGRKIRLHQFAALAGMVCWFEWFLQGGRPRGDPVCPRLDIIQIMRHLRTDRRTGSLGVWE